LIPADGRRLRAQVAVEVAPNRVGECRKARHLLCKIGRASHDLLIEKTTNLANEVGGLTSMLLSFT
jgi:hypothetical protein